MPNQLANCELAGELALSGKVRPIRGALAMAWQGRKQAKRAFILPSSNATQVAVMPNVEAYGADSLPQGGTFKRHHALEFGTAICRIA